MNQNKDHWLYEFLLPKNKTNQHALNQLEQFANNVPLLEEPLTMVSIDEFLKETHYESANPKFHIVVDKNSFAYILKYSYCLHHYFCTYGPDHDNISGLHNVLTPESILYVSKEAVDTTPELMFGRYDKQMLHVYHTLPRKILQDESTPVSDMITKSFRELEGPWAIKTNPLNQIK